MIQKLFRKYLPTCLLLTMAISLMSFTVVIDAGHGGHDAGAVGLKMKVQEKDLNLTVAKQLAAKIQGQYPEVNVVLTRNTDVFLPLQQRADIANKNHANLLLASIQTLLRIVMHVVRRLSSWVWIVWRTIWM